MFLVSIITLLLNTSAYPTHPGGLYEKCGRWNGPCQSHLVCRFGTCARPQREPHRFGPSPLPAPHTRYVGVGGSCGANFGDRINYKCKAGLRCDREQYQTGGTCVSAGPTSTPASGPTDGQSGQTCRDDPRNPCDRGLYHVVAGRACICCPTTKPCWELGASPFNDGQLGGDPFNDGQLGASPFNAGQLGGDPFNDGQLGGNPFIRDNVGLDGDCSIVHNRKRITVGKCKAGLRCVIRGYLGPPFTGKCEPSGPTWPTPAPVDGPGSLGEDCIPGTSQPCNSGLFPVLAGRSCLCCPSNHLCGGRCCGRLGAPATGPLQIGAVLPNPFAPPVGTGASILRGKTDADFAYLDPRHPYAWVVGPIAVDKMLKMSPREQMDFVGWPLDLVHQLLCAGNTFKILKFDFKSIPFATRANWEGLVWALRNGDQATAASKKCADKVEPHLAVLKSMPWKELIAKYGDPRKLSASDKAQFQSFENFAKSDREDVFAARAFLYYTMDADELYYGDGWTYDAKGVRGGDEYLVTPMKLSDIKGHTLTDMDVHCDPGQAPATNYRHG